MYSVINITQNPPTIVTGTENFTEQQCIEWIILNGNILTYSIIENN